MRIPGLFSGQYGAARPPTAQGEPMSLSLVFSSPSRRAMRSRTPGESAISREISRSRCGLKPCGTGFFKTCPASVVQELNQLKCERVIRTCPDTSPGVRTLEGLNTMRVQEVFASCESHPLDQGDQSPAADRPGCLLFLRREESLEVTARGSATPKGARLFVPSGP